MVSEVFPYYRITDFRRAVLDGAYSIPFRLYISDHKERGRVTGWRETLSGGIVSSLSVPLSMVGDPLGYFRITILPISSRDLSPILSGGNERPPARDGDPREFLSLAVLLSDYKETERDRETHPGRLSARKRGTDRDRRRGDRPSMEERGNRGETIPRPEDVLSPFGCIWYL